MATAKQQLEQFQFSFDEADVNKSGTLTPDEVIYVIINQGGTPEDAQLIFNFMDRDKNYAITRQEFSDSVGSLPPHVQEGFALRKLFKAIDRNNSGTLTMDEIYGSVGQISGLSNDEIMRLMTLASVDASGEIDYEEFLRFYGKENTAVYLRQLFNKLDTDKSGFLNFEEVKKAIDDQPYLRLSAQKLYDLAKTLIRYDADERLNYEEFIAAWKK